MIRVFLFKLQFWLEPIWLGGSLRIARVLATSTEASTDGSMKVLVHIANHNGEAWVSDAISSILNQTHQNWGLLIIDDCSSDSSPMLIEELAKTDDRIKFIALDENIGTAKVHNRALKLFHAETQWDAFCILDCDDVALPNLLSIGICALRCGSVGLRPILSRYDEDLEVKKWDYVGCNQTVWSRDTIRELGYYRLKPFMYDHDFMERAKRYAFLKRKFLLQSGIPLQKMRMRGNNQSLNKKTQEELKAENLSVEMARGARKVSDLFFQENE